MAFQIPTVQYTGKINEVVLGSAKKIKVGGETAYSFMTFEGQMPNKPKIAMEIWDMDPSNDWPEAVKAPFAGVLGDPGAWAKKCIEYGADMIVVQLKSTDPNGLNKGADHAVAAVKAVLEAVDVPVIVYGVANKEKDTETLRAVAEAFQGKNLVLGPVEEGDHKQVGAQALAYGHVVAANTPIDVNLAKQLNILLGNLGIKNDKILIDPTTGGLGYGMEYCYSVMERIRMAALVQQDENLQQPLVNNMANEVWKCKEANQTLEDAPTLGYQEDRGVMMEVTEAVALLLAGSDVLFLRHPESVKLVRQYIDLLLEGGEVAAEGLKAVQTVPADKLPKVEWTPPEPPKKEKKEAAPAKKPAAPPKPEAKPAAPPKPEAKPAAPPKPEASPKKEEPAKVVAIDEAKAKTEAEARQKAEAEAKAKAEEEARKKAEAEAKAKVEAEAKAKAQEEARKKAEAEAAEKAKIKEEERLQALRAARAKEREELEAKRAAEAEGPREMKKAEVTTPKEYVVAEQIIRSLDRVHMRHKR